MVAAPQNASTNAKAASRGDVVGMVVLKVNLREAGLSNGLPFSGEGRPG
jgi:hypothetical protein